MSFAPHPFLAGLRSLLAFLAASLRKFLKIERHARRLRLTADLPLLRTHYTSSRKMLFGMWRDLQSSLNCQEQYKIYAQASHPF